MIETWCDLHIGIDRLYDRDIAERGRGKLSKTPDRALTWQGANVFVTLVPPSQLAGVVQ